MKLNCDVEGYTNAFVVIPDEWLVMHSRKRKKALDALAELDEELNEVENFIIALSICDDFGGFPGCDPKKPISAWEFDNFPIALIGWLIRNVIKSFNAAFVISKN